MSFANLFGFGQPTDDATTTPPQGVLPTPDADPASPTPLDGAGSAPPQPQTVTLDQFNQLTSTVDRLATLMTQAMTPEPEPAPAPAPIPAPQRTVTMDMVNQAAIDATNTGDWRRYNELLAKHTDEAVAERLHTFEQTKFQPIIQNGMQTMAQMAEQSAQALPHYTKYKREIDQVVRSMGANASATPHNWKLAHDYIVGLHVNDLINEQVEARIRQASADPGGGPAPSSKAAKSTAKLTVRDAYGSDGYADLQKLAEMQGRTAEQLVQLQYAKSRFAGSFDDYLKAQHQSREITHV